MNATFASVFKIFNNPFNTWAKTYSGDVIFL